MSKQIIGQAERLRLQRGTTTGEAVAASRVDWERSERLKSALIFVNRIMGSGQQHQLVETLRDIMRSRRTQ